MKKIILIISCILVFFYTQNISAQYYQSDCIHLKKEGETYGAGDGGGKSWCEMESTPYVDCMCQAEKNQKTMQIQEENIVKNYNEQATEVYRLIQEARNVDFAGNHEQAISMLENAMQKAKSIQTGGVEKYEAGKQEYIKTIQDAIDNAKKNLEQANTKENKITLSPYSESTSNYDNTEAQKRAQEDDLENDNNYYYDDYKSENEIAAEMANNIYKETADNIARIEKASAKLSATISDAINDGISYQQFNDQVEALTTISSSKNPKAIMAEYRQKVKELNNAYDKRLKEQLRQIERDYARNMASASGENAEQIKLGATIGASVSTIIVEEQMKKAKKEAKQKLKEEKAELLREIRDDLLSDYESKYNKYKIKAAAEVHKKLEVYYESMANYYACKYNRVAEEFSTNSTSWADPYCEKPYFPSGNFQQNPSAELLYLASKRKRNSNDENYQKYASKLLDIAIKKSPTNTKYLFEKASYYPMGSSKNLEYLGRCHKINRRNKTFKDYYYYSYALNKKQSSYFKVYLDKIPNGEFYTDAQQWYDYYLDKEIKKVKYKQEIKILNQAITEKDYEKALKTYRNVVATEFFNKSDINDIYILYEYKTYAEAQTVNSSQSYINYINKYPYGKWLSNAKTELHKILESDADKAKNSGDYDQALSFYRYYLKTYPNDKRSSEIQEKIYETEALQQRLIIADGDAKFWTKNYTESEKVFIEYLKKYPDGSYSEYAESMLVKIEFRNYYSDGFFWTIDHKGAFGFSWSFYSNGLGASTGLKFNPFALVKMMSWEYGNYSDIHNYFLKPNSKFKDFKYVFSIHYEFNHQIFPRFWLGAGVEYGYYARYYGGDEYENYDWKTNTYSNYTGQKFYALDYDYSEWKPALRMSSIYAIKLNLKVKYTITFKYGLTHEIGISFAGPW